MNKEELIKKFESIIAANVTLINLYTESTESVRSSEHLVKVLSTLLVSLRALPDIAPPSGAVWVKDDITKMELNIGRLKVECFDEDGEMSVRVGGSKPQRLRMDEAKEVANFFISHIKNESEANPDESTHSSEAGIREALGKCQEKECKKDAVKDYNGHGHFVFETCYKHLSDHFDEEYK